MSSSYNDGRSSYSVDAVIGVDFIVITDGVASLIRPVEDVVVLLLF